MNILKTYTSSTRIGGPAVRKSRQRDIEALPKPYLTWLLAFFAGWKLFLLAVAYASPGPGYDTSAQILFDQYDSSPPSTLPRFIESLVLRLTRWDAIYFSSTSVRGHIYEQEWAFSWCMSRLTALLSNAFPSSLHPSPIIKHALAGITIAHFSHLGAVLTLYALVRNLVPSTPSRKRRIAFTAACLHTVSPAGLFLSAPYTESPFALLTFLGLHAYALAQQPSSSPTRTSALTLASGLALALSTLLRTNGLLHAALFALDALSLAHRTLASRTATLLPHLLSSLLAGLLLATAFALPQALAYAEFCLPDASPPPRPWCAHLPPSVYSFVQKHYWGVGFLSYWTAGNAPLFALAAPMLAVLLGTGWVAVFRGREVSALAAGGPAGEETAVFERVLGRFAVPQLLLAGLAATSFHVQIVNRICSGCVGWYVLGAVGVVATADGGRGLMGGGKGRSRWVEVGVRAMVAYSVVQGGLYAAFLPPA